MMRTMRRLLVVLAIVLTACGSPPPKAGYVTEKKYEPAHWEGGYRTWSSDEYTCGYGFDYSKGEYGNSCGIKSVEHSEWEDHHSWVDDNWSFYLSDCHFDKGKQKCNKGWLDVSQETYGNYNQGAHYPDPR